MSRCATCGGTLRPDGRCPVDVGMDALDEAAEIARAAHESARHAGFRSEWA